VRGSEAAGTAAEVMAETMVVNWDRLPDAMMVLDADGLLVTSNRRFTRTVGPMSTLRAIDVAKVTSAGKTTTHGVVAGPGRAFMLVDLTARARRMTIWITLAGAWVYVRQPDRLVRRVSSPPAVLASEEIEQQTEFSGVKGVAMRGCERWCGGAKRESWCRT